MLKHFSLIFIYGQTLKSDDKYLLVGLTHNLSFYINWFKLDGKIKTKTWKGWNETGAKREQQHLWRHRLGFALYQGILYTNGKARTAVGPVKI